MSADPGRRQTPGRQGVSAQPATAGHAGETIPSVVSSRPVYQGKIVDLRVDEIVLPHGGTTLREVVSHPGAVVVAALDADEHVYLVRQYRHAIGQYLLELPAGTLEPAEEPLATAKRELREEVGLVADDWFHLGSFWSTPGFVNEHLHAYLARELTEVPRDPDDDEDITVVRCSLKELLQHLEDIPDAKSLATLLLVRGAVQQDRGNTT